MTDLNLKHPNYNNDLLPEHTDLFKPDFRRDSRGRYFMQLPGYGKWMVGVEPGSKIIAQGSEGEDGGPATDPGSIRTGSLHATTVITIGDNIYLDGNTGCIHVGDYINRIGTSISMCGNGLFGYSGKDVRFGFWLEDDGPIGQGDFFVGDFTNDEYIHWDNSEGDLIIKGDLVIQGDVISANYVAGVSGYKLTYLTGSAEFQDVWVRGRVQMEAGSSGSASYISETLTRFWAIEPNADNTASNTSNDTSYVSGTLASQVAMGSARALNAINASNRYQTWLRSSDMQASGVATGPAVVMDNTGIYAWNSLGQNTLFIDSGTGNAMIRGTIYASAGLIANWVIDVYRLWKQVIGSGNYTKVEMSANDTGGAFPHFQVFTDTNSAYSSPTGIQMTVGNPSSPVPRIDIYKDGIKRVMLSGGQPSGVGAHEAGLYFFNTSGTVISKITPGNSDGDVTFGGGVVRLFGNGVRVSYQQPFSAADNAGRYFQMYCDSTVYGVAGILSAPASNFIKIANDGGGSIAYFNGVPGGQWALSLFGNLALYTNTYDQGSTLGALYYNTSTGTLRIRGNSGWMDVGGSALPGGGAYQMLRFDLSTLEWVNTSNVYYGSSGSYYIAKVGVDTWFNVPSGSDFTFVRGGTHFAVIDENIWTRGTLYANGQLSVGGTIQNSSGDIICNSGNLQLRKTGAIVAVRDSGGTTRYLTCKLDAIVGKYILST